MNELMKRLDRIEQLTLLGAKNVLTLDEVCLFSGLAKSTVYKMTASKAIPFYRADNGKHLYFKKSEVEDWLTRNRIGSKLEDEQRAIAEHFCNKVKKGGLQ